MARIEVRQEGASTIAKHGADAFPNECCGFFFGSVEDVNGAEYRLIQFVKPVLNSKEGDQRRRFSISPQDYMAAERYALENETTLLGIYHSHPNHPAIPSEHDLRQAVPFFSYIIISVQEGIPDHIRSWRLSDEGKFEEEEIVGGNIHHEESGKSQNSNTQIQQS